jgi:glycosyltransferase involved in cell wall biosynthesis
MNKLQATQGISVVTTTWNEKENIEELIRRIRTTLQMVTNEVIVVDDSSSDGTIEVAKRTADVAIGKPREGQTKGLLYGAKIAKYPIIVTIDSDLENSPELIPALIEKLDVYDVVVASRTFVPRFSERWAARTLGKKCGISDFYSNFRAYKKETIINVFLKGGETFGGELLVIAKKKGFKVGELVYEAPPRRSKPRIGGTIMANWRIIVATWKCLLMFFVS